MQLAPRGRRAPPPPSHGAGRPGGRPAGCPCRQAFPPVLAGLRHDVRAVVHDEHGGDRHDGAPALRRRALGAGDVAGDGLRVRGAGAGHGLGRGRLVARRAASPLRRVGVGGPRRRPLAVVDDDVRVDGARRRAGRGCAAGRDGQRVRPGGRVPQRVLPRPRAGDGVRHGLLAVHRRPRSLPLVPAGARAPARAPGRADGAAGRRCGSRRGGRRLGPATLCGGHRRRPRGRRGRNS